MEFKDRVANKPNRVKLTYEDSGASSFVTVELADEPIENGTPLNKQTFDNLQQELNAYVVGNVLITSTNKNPSEYLGGTWELIDKGFSGKSNRVGEGENYFTPAPKVSLVNCAVMRDGRTVRVRLQLTINTKMDDTGMRLGDLVFEEIGIFSIPFGFFGLVSYEDTANGGISWQVDWETGTVYQADVIGTSPIPSGKTFTLDFVFIASAASMIDTFCDKFYWKRTK